MIEYFASNKSLIRLIKVDGKVLRFMGKKDNNPESITEKENGESVLSAYTFEQPAANWMNKDFEDSIWKKSSMPFGGDTSRAITLWTAKNIWLRKSFTLKQIPNRSLLLKLHHERTIEVYLNGEKIYGCTCKNRKLNICLLKILLEQRW
jgi:hypothetical protein